MALPESASFTAADVDIPGGDGNISAKVTWIALRLTRDVTLDNREVTYWKLTYNYFNGGLRWEEFQQLYIDFTDKDGVTLMPMHAITVTTPSRDCHEAPGINMRHDGQFDFDFRGKQLTIKGSGSTPDPGAPGRDHTC